MASEFQKQLLAKKMKRDEKIAERGIDPVTEVDLNVSVKRKPLLEANTDLSTNKKQKTDARREQRKAKLAQLTAQLRSIDNADRGISPVPMEEEVPREPSPPPEQHKPSKRSRWAQMAAERAIWDEQDSVTPTKLGKVPPVEKAPPVVISSSCRDQVESALSKSGKNTVVVSGDVVPKINLPKIKTFEDQINNEQHRRPKVKLDSTPVSKRFIETKPKPKITTTSDENKAPPLEKNSSLLELRKIAKVNRLIAGFETKTPEHRNLPESIMETRGAVEYSDESMDVDITPPPNNMEKESTSTTVVPESDMSYEDVKDESSIESCSNGALNFPIDSAVIDNLDAPGMQSTKISDTIESFHMDDSVVESTTDETCSNITGYKRGHSMSFVNNQFGFLVESKTSIKSHLSTRRERQEILDDVAEKSYYEDGDDLVSPRSKTKRRSNTVGGDDISLLDFNPKSIASFRKTQRIKNYETRATASAIFKESETEEVKVSSDMKKKELEIIISAQMSIIRQTSAALSVCTDARHGKGTQTQVAAEACLLEASKRYEAAKSGLQKLKTKETSSTLSCGRLEIGDIHLRTRYQEHFQSPQNTDATHWILAVIQVDDQIHVTDVKEINNIKEQKSLILKSKHSFKNIRQDFNIDVSIYTMATRAPIEGKKSKPLGGIKLFKLGFKKSSSVEKLTSNPALMSAGGPNAVRKSNFRSIGHASITMDTAQSYEQYKLQTTWDALIQSVFAMTVEMKFTKAVEFSSFLTIRKGGDSSYGDWRRFWAVLSRDRITFWKYPEDREDLPQEGYISLRYALNKEVKTANRALTSRPNCLELYCSPLAPDQKRNPTHFEGIVSSYDPSKFQRYLFSADTNEEKQEWCKALMSTLDKLRVWHRELPQPVKDSLQN